LCSSDSHFLDEIGAACTDLYLAEATFAELALALAGTGGRSASRGAIPGGRAGDAAGPGGGDSHA
jgi:hypothetical protein